MRAENRLRGPLSRGSGGRPGWRVGGPAAPTCVLVLALLVAAPLPAEARSGVAPLAPAAAERAAAPPPARSAAGAPQQTDEARSPRAGSGPVEPHPEAVEAIGRLKSPFCPGLMLEVCPSPEAGALRDTLEMMARAGVESDSLVSWTLARYGEEWRAVPQTRGTGLLAWIVPPLAIVLGVGLVVVALRRLRGDGDDPEGGSGEARQLSPEEERRLSEALGELEREGR